MQQLSAVYSVHFDPKYNDEASLAKFRGKRRTPQEESEVADYFRIEFSNVCPHLMVLLEQKNLFTS